MNQLPDDLVLEVFQRLPHSAAVALGATNKEYYALSKEAIGRRQIQPSNLESVTLLIHRLITRCRAVKIYRCDGTMRNTYTHSHNRKIRVANSYFRNPSRWSGHLYVPVVLNNGDIMNTLVMVGMRVTPAQELAGWRFDFDLSYVGGFTFMEQKERERFLFHITTPRERQDLAITLLASWYAHARDTLNGRRLRSFHKQSWLPERLPSLHRYMQAAYPFLLAFVHNLYKRA